MLTPPDVLTTTPGTPAIPTGLLEQGPFAYLLAFVVFGYLGAREINRLRRNDLRETSDELDAEKLARKAEVEDLNLKHRQEIERLIALHRAETASERKAHREDVEGLKEDIAELKTEVVKLRDENFTSSKDAAAKLEALLRENAALRAFLASNNLDPKGVLPRADENPEQ